MLSLSIFCSSQTISLALYSGEHLESFFEKEILEGRLDGFFTSLKNFVKIEDFKKIKKIFFSTGPGSFTATRSIKSISQGLSLYSGAELISTSTFSLFLSKLDYKSENILVCFNSIKGKVFFRLIKKNKKYLPISDVHFGKTSDLKKFIVAEDKKPQEIFLISDNHELKNQFEKKNLKIVNVNAKDLANSVFKGYGEKEHLIYYHNTYYE